MHLLIRFFFSSRRRHTRYWRDWSSDVCSSDLTPKSNQAQARSNQVMTENERKSNQADEKSNQPRINLVTRKLTKKEEDIDRKSTRLNSSHANISYAVFCLKKKKRQRNAIYTNIIR